jgi:hypothetical protein
VKKCIADTVEEGAPITPAIRETMEKLGKKAEASTVT